MTNATLITAKVAGTDKMRIRFCLQNFSQKMQDVIFTFFKRKWEKDVTVVRWPRPNIVEVRLSYNMIRTAGFLEVTQEVRSYWQRFLLILQREESLLTPVHHKRN